MRLSLFPSEAKGVHSSCKGDAPAVHTLMQRVSIRLGILPNPRQAADREVLSNSLASQNATQLASALMLAELESVGRHTFTPGPSRTLLPPPSPPSQTFTEPGQPPFSLASLIQYLGYPFEGAITSPDDTSSDCIPSYILPSRSELHATASFPGLICTSASMSISKSPPTPGITISRFTFSITSDPSATISSEPPLSREMSSTTFFTTSPFTPSVTRQLSSAETFISSTLTSPLPASQSAISISISDTPILLSSSTSITNTISSPESSDTIPNTSVHSPSASSSVISTFTSSSDLSTSASSTTPVNSINSATETATTSFLSPILSAEISLLFSTKITTITVVPSTAHRNGVMSTSTSLEPGVLSTSISKGPAGFARNTGAIVGVAVTCTCVIIMAVVILFLLCKRRKGKHYWSGDFRSSAGLQFTPWQPPLAGDDDAPFYMQQVRGHSAGSFQHLGSASHASDMAHPGTEVLGAEHNIHELNHSESSFSHTQRRSLTHHPISLQDRTELASPSTTNTYHSPMPPSAWSEPLYGPFNLYERTSLPSLHARTSNGHLYANTSSHGHSHTPPSSHGHGYSGSSSHGDMYANTSYVHTPATSSGHELLATNSSPPRDSLNLKNFVGRLRSGRGSLPNIIVEKIASRSSSRHSLPLQPPPPPPTPSFRAVSALSLDRPNKPTLGPITTQGLWPPATLPPLPSPTNTENSRMFEDLLTPHLGTRIASSQYSSSASLRDNVDYSRPINGAIRNLVHSTRTYSTDTDTIVEGRNE